MNIQICDSNAWSFIAIYMNRNPEEYIPSQFMIAVKSLMTLNTDSKYDRYLTVILQM